ncbi:MAG: hypothetical protein KDD53_05200, partial [Bdellovibrionales bacterium]|nr:hypothetical protein [Bdellovibrionales bacterium]
MKIETVNPANQRPDESQSPRASSLSLALASALLPAVAGEVEASVFDPSPIILNIAAAPSEVAPIAVSKASEIISLNRDSHARFFTIGSPRIGAEAEREISTLLSHRENWIVIVGGDVRFNTYRNEEGEVFEDIEAIKEEVGKTLYNETNFSKLTDPRTGLKNGAILVITLNPKGISYYFADGFAELGVDENDDSLYVPVQDALRDGLRIGDAVRGGVEAVETKLTEAIDWQKEKPYVFGAVILAALLAAGAIARSRNLKSSQKVSQLTAKWREVVADQQEEVLDLRKSANEIASDPNSTGETRKLADLAVENARHVLLIRSEMLAALRFAEEKTTGGGFLAKLSSKGANQALARITDEPIPFDRDSAISDILREGQARTSALEDGLKHVERESRTFTQLAEELAERTRKCRDSIREYTEARSTVQQTIKLAEEELKTIQRAAQKLQGTKEAEPELAILDEKPVRENLIPALERELLLVKEMAKTDPVGVLSRCRTFGKRVRSAVELCQALTVSSDLILEISDDEAKLRKADLTPEWIRSSMEEIIGKASEVFAQIEKGEKYKIPDIASELKELKENTSRAVETMDGVVSCASSDVPRQLSAIDAAKREFANEIRRITGEEPNADAILHEKSEDDPTEWVRSAQADLESARAAIEIGNVSNASQSFLSAKMHLEEANNSITDTRTALTSYPESLAAVNQAQDNLRSKRDLANGVLESLKRDYDPEILQIGEGDPRHEGTDYTAANNIEEADEQLSSGAHLISEAQRALQDGRILDADFALTKAAASFDFVDLRIQEIEDKAARIKQAEADIKKAKEAIQASLDKTGREIRDSKITQSTIDDYAAA